MPFETLSYHTRSNMPPQATMTYMRPIGRGKNAGQRRADAKPQLSITIPTTLCGTAKAETFELQLGVGKDTGKVRIAGAKGDAGVKPAELKHVFRFNFGYVPRLGDDIFDTQRCDVRKISDDVFEIDVQASWFEDAGDDE